MLKRGHTPLRRGPDRTTHVRGLTFQTQQRLSLFGGPVLFEDCRRFVFLTTHDPTEDCIIALTGQIHIKDQTENIYLAVLIFGSTLCLGILRQLYPAKDNRTDIANVSGSAESFPHSPNINIGGAQPSEINRPARARTTPVRYAPNNDAVQNLFDTMSNYQRKGAMHSEPPLSCVQP